MGWGVREGRHPEDPASATHTPFPKVLFKLGRDLPASAGHCLGEPLQHLDTGQAGSALASCLYMRTGLIPPGVGQWDREYPASVEKEIGF